MTLNHIETLKGTLNSRGLKALVCAVAMVMLTGAKGEGCGGGEEPQPTEPCAPGFHLETTCDDYCAVDSAEPGSDGDVTCGGDCQEICVPDGPCPEGTVEEWICDPMPLSESAPCLDGDLGCVDPDPNCYLECVAVDVCGPGFHEEWECFGVGEPEPAADSGSDSASEPVDPPPPEECFLTCAPDLCPAGYVEETICAAAVSDPSVPEPPPGEEPLPIEECWTECMPDMVCPAGQHPEEVCTYCAPEPLCQFLCVDDFVSEPTEPQAS